MTAIQPGPNLTAHLAAAGTSREELSAAVSRALDDVVNRLFVGAVRDQMLNQWHTEHDGNSLVAYLNSAGTVVTCHEMPTAHAIAAELEQPDTILILKTWGA